MRSPSRLVLAVFAVLAVSPSAAHGQGVTFAAGGSRYDLQGSTGTGLVGAIRFGIPFRTYVIAEPGLTFLRWKSIVGTTQTYLIGEISFQVQGYLGRLRPYVGSGIGISSPSRAAPGANQNYFTLHAAAGARFYVSRGFGIRAELRARAIQPWHGSSYDLTVGVIQVTGGMGR
jgi:hypothetical protein